MGVFMPMDLRSKTPEEGLFDSNAALINLVKIEGLLNHLAPPKWPEDVLGKIDRKKARRVKSYLPQIARNATTPIPTLGRNRTSMESASSKLGWCRKDTLARIRDSSKT